MRSNWDSHTLLVRIENGVFTLEKSLAVSFNVLLTFTIWPRILHVGVYPTEIKIHVHAKTCIKNHWIVYVKWRNL